VRDHRPGETPLNIEDQTVQFWAERTGEEYSREDARQMVANISGFFAVLAEWERRHYEEKLCKET
jgi:hypothetical protein